MRNVQNERPLRDAKQPALSFASFPATCQETQVGSLAVWRETDTSHKRLFSCIIQVS